MEKIIFIIPAKSSSLRIKNKNMKKLGDKPLLFHKIKTCLETNLGSVFVSTDSKRISNYSTKLGAQASFLRPKKYSTSKATMMSCVLHLLRYFKNNLINLPEYVAIMPPTNPFVTASSIKKAFQKLRLNRKYNSICSFTESADHPFLVVHGKKKLQFNSVKYLGYKFSDFERSQDYPKAFTLTGSIRITKTSYFFKYILNLSSDTKKNVTDLTSCIGYELNKREAFDINNKNDFDIAQLLVKNKNFFID